MMMQPAQPTTSILLSQQEACGLAVDLVAYPEDTYLVVDPYSGPGQTPSSWFKALQDAQHKLPRPLGEVFLYRSSSVLARYLVRMVVLDFEKPPAVRTEVLETALQDVFRQASWLGLRSLCLDRMELLENSLSAYRLLKIIRECCTGAAPNGAGNGLRSIVLTLTPGPCWRRFEMAFCHLKRE
jgi:hypothetical protein